MKPAVEVPKTFESEIKSLPVNVERKGQIYLENVWW